MNKSEAAKKRIGDTFEIRKRRMSELGKKRWGKISAKERSEFASKISKQRWIK